MTSFYGTYEKPKQTEWTPTPVVEPVDDESLLVNVHYPERFSVVTSWRHDDDKG